MFKVSLDPSDLIKRIEYVNRKQIPAATARALNTTVGYAQRAVQNEMIDVFEQPTPFTIRSVFVRRAKPDKLQAFVFIRDEAAKGTPPVKYLAPQVLGGGRRAKRFERALRATGVLAAGEFAYIGKKAPIDQYGNIRAGTYTRILSQVRSSRDPAQNVSDTPRAASRRGAQYFVPRPGSNLKRGVYERKGRTVLPILIFSTDEPSYKRRLDFVGIVRGVFVERYQREWTRQFLSERRGRG